MSFLLIRVYTCLILFLRLHSYVAQIVTILTIFKTFFHNKSIVKKKRHESENYLLYPTA